MSTQGPAPFPRMLAIFFAVFHPQAGPSVIYQVPSDFVGSFSSAGLNGSDHAFCVDMDSISEYVIPKRQLCDRLISVCNSGYRILGYPVRVEGSQYERNAFIFNCCIVFDESDDVSAFTPVVRRMARVLRSMEELKKSLSSTTERDIVYSVIEEVLEDLNGHGECRIPIIDDEVTLNIRLFPQYSQPQKVKDWQVPLPLLPLKKMVDSNWDLTVQRVIPHIDGIASVKQISERSDVDPLLVAKCVQHLLYYNCLILTDIFHFSAIYATTPELSVLNFNEALKAECLEYVARSSTERRLDWPAVFELYASLRSTITLKEWLRSNYPSAKYLDIRRFISFGVVRGFLYRIHTFPFLAEENRRTSLTVLADGTKHLDEICTRMNQSYQHVMNDLQSHGQVRLIHR